MAFANAYTVQKRARSSVHKKCQQKPDLSPVGFANGKPRRSQRGRDQAKPPELGV